MIMLCNMKTVSREKKNEDEIQATENFEPKQIQIRDPNHVRRRNMASLTLSVAFAKGICYTYSVVIYDGNSTITLALIFIGFAPIAYLMLTIIITPN